MKRREFITLLGGASVVWPLAARAQQPAMPVIGFLSSRSPHEAAYVVAAFHRGLREGGYSEGQNVGIEYRWAEGQYDRLPELAVDLVRRKVALIASTGGIGAAIAAKQATSTIPIVFTVGDDPITHGLVASFSRPGGNVTGIYNFISAIEAKRFGLLRETVPTTGSIAVLLNPNYLGFDVQLKDLQEAARAVGQQIGVFNASSEADIHDAFRAAPTAWHTKLADASEEATASSAAANASKNKIFPITNPSQPVTRPALMCRLGGALL